ncbi:MAG: DNA/RNA nuclease SfsA [Paracoccaceae bacterium]
MRFQTPLVPARLIRRYKRFLADCHLEDGQEITAHCANPGSMMGLATPGTKVWLEPNNDPKKKLKFGWRLVDHQNGHFTGVDTAVPNRVLGAALRANQIADFAEYDNVRGEVKYGANSRIDYLLTQDGLPAMYLEIKSVTLSRQPSLAEFPDSVTARGTKHLEELQQMVQDGHRAAMFFLVQRTDCTEFDLAEDIDPAYAAAFDAARKAGVEAYCFDTRITPHYVEMGNPIRILT